MHKNLARPGRDAAEEGNLRTGVGGSYTLYLFNFLPHAFITSSINFCFLSKRSFSFSFFYHRPFCSSVPGERRAQDAPASHTGGPPAQTLG